MNNVKTDNKRRRGFTLVELIVVLAIMALMAALVGAGIISYIRLARFNKNEANARTIYQAAQTALTRLDATGGLDDYLARVAGENGNTQLGVRDIYYPGDTGDPTLDVAQMEAVKDKVNERVYAVFYDKANPDTDSSKLVKELLDNYIYDKSLMNASMCIEIDASSGNVFAVFYDTNSESFSFTEPTGPDVTNINSRGFQQRHDNTLVGYYSVDDLVNTVRLEDKIKLEFITVDLVNGEQLTLEWSTTASKAVDPGIEYTACIYDADATDPDAKPILTIAIKPGDVYDASTKYIKCRVTGENDADLGEYWFPMVNEKGTFKLSLDAMVSAEILQTSAADADDALETNTRQNNYSFTRFFPDMKLMPNNIYAQMTSSLVEGSEAEKKYSVSDPSGKTESRNTLFDDATTVDTVGGTGYDGTISKFRHLYNLRWLKDDATTNPQAVYKGKFTIQPEDNNTLDWAPEKKPIVPTPDKQLMAEDIVVYHTPAAKTVIGGETLDLPTAATPYKDAAVAFPTIDTLAAGITLTGSKAVGSENAIIKNLQLRSDSVAPDVITTGKEYYAKYVGLIGHNYGTVQNLTLQDVDAVINVPGFDTATTAAARDAALKTVTDATLTKTAKLPLTALRGVGALCGINTGVVTDVQLTEGVAPNVGTSRVVAVVPFGAAPKTGQSEPTDGKPISENLTTTALSLRGIGGLVGISRPAFEDAENSPEDAAHKPLYKLNNLTTGGTVAGLLLDMDPAAATAPASDEAYYKTALADENYKPIGIGGTVGFAIVSDGIGLTKTVAGERMTLTNNAQVLGNGYTGGVAGNLLADKKPTGTAPNAVPAVTLTELTNTGRVQATAGFKPETSKSLGRFFGGVAGYTAFTGLNGAKNSYAVQVGKEADALTLASVRADLALAAPQYFKGDFVGGITGFVDTGLLTGCTTGAAATEVETATTNTYVLGNRFVGGCVGGSNGTKLTGNKNASVVIGREYVGGIAGAAGGGSTLLNCANSGPVAAVGSADGTVPARYVGGIVGITGFADAAGAPATTVTGCTNTVSDGFTPYLKSIGAQNAEFAGGLVGYNTAGSIINVSGAVSAAITGKSFVGGVAGYNDGSIVLGEGDLTATLTGLDFVGGIVGVNGTGGTITGPDTGRFTVQGSINGGTAVGGAIGLNRAAALPEGITIDAAVAGYRYVGGIIGANMPVGSFAIGNINTSEDCTVSADAVAGGLIGYNRPTAAAAVTDTAAAKTADVDLATYYKENFLPVIDVNTGIIIGNAAVADAAAAIVINGLENSASVTANAYAGGIFGYADEHVALMLTNCTNKGGISRRDDGQTWEDADGNTLPTMANGVSLRAYFGDTARGFDAAYTAVPNALFADAASDVRAAMIGGIISISGEKNTLENCINSGSITGNGNVIGGLMALNLGTVTNGSNTISIGTSNMNYIGGLVGINAKTAAGAGTITGGSVKVDGTGTAVTGGLRVGGLAGANLWGATVTTADDFETTVMGNTETGGVSGLNCGTVSGSMANSKITGVTNTGGAVGRNDGTITKMTLADTVEIYGTTNAGGVAGINYGTIGSDAGSVRTAATVSASTDCAGGIAGFNAENAKLVNTSVTAGKIASANGIAGGIAACNAGEITNCTIGNGSITIEGKGTHTPAGTSNELTGAGAVAAINLQTGKIINTVVEAKNDGTAGVTLNTGMAANIGALAGYNMGTVDSCTVHAMPKLQNLTPESITIGGAVGYNHSPDPNTPAVVSNTTVRADITDNNTKIKQLGGVAGHNDGTLINCTYTGTLGDGIGSAVAPADYKLGGIAGNNTKRIENCKATGINLQIQGNASPASSLGGIAGYNANGATITGSTVAAGTGTTSFIIARYGNVGGVAGSNAGTIIRSGSAEAMDMVTWVNTWLYTSNGANAAEQTQDKNDRRAAMDRVLSGDINSNGEEKALTEKFNTLKGVDTVRAADKGYGAVYSGTANGNDVLVALHADASNTSAGYLGGLVGCNLAGGSVTESATGKWFVYGDNLDQNSTGTANVAVGGAIGRNESDAENRNIINNAAVRRFTRTDAADTDSTSATPINSQTYVGGVIGVQYNTTSATWTLDGAINCGTVFNSNGANIGGVISRWAANGGTVQNSYNYGALTTNRDGSIAGVAGGIVGTAEVTGSDLRILSCRSFGSIARVAQHGAAEAAGILGRINATTAGESGNVNIIDCLNGNNALDAKTQTTGICGRLAGANALNTFINIDHCRNYSTNLTVEENSGNYINAAGISAPRDAGRAAESDTTGYTAINYCFALYNSEATGYNASPFIGDSGQPAYFTGKYNYYMDAASFDADNNAGLAAMNRTDPGGTGPANGSAPPETNATKQVMGHRLFAGADTATAAADAPNDYNYFAALLMLDNNDTPIYNPASITNANSYITAAGNAFANRAVLRRLTAGANTLATLPLLYKEGDGVAGLTIHDVRDEAITNYYNYILEEAKLGVPGTPTMAKISDTAAADKNRYAINWTAPTTGTVNYYRVTIYSETADPAHPAVLSEATVYGTRYVHKMTAADESKKVFAVVTACNSRQQVSSARSTTIPVAQPLALMQLSLEMLGDGKTAAVTLLNADTYNTTAGAGCWTATAALTAADGSTVSVDLDADMPMATVETAAFAADEDGLLVLEGHADVVPDTPAAEKYYRSADVSEEVYLPLLLPEGRLQAETPIATGETALELSVSETLGFKSDTGVQPVYHVALLGRRTAPLADEAAGIELQGQYITLAAKDVTLPEDPVTVSFDYSDLPRDYLENYDDFTLIAIPYESGQGDCRTYHEMSAEELVSTGLGTAAAEAVLDSGIEILRNEDGEGWIYRSVMPLTLPKKDTADTCRRDALNITTLEAPALMESFAEGEPQVTDSTMTYTFTWATPETAAVFSPQLTGLTYDETGAIAAETPIDVTNAYPDDTAATLTADAAGWAFDAVRLTVAAKGGVTAEGPVLGMAATATYDVQQRLPRLSGTAAESADVTGRTLRYSVRWDAPAEEDAANIASVTVFATDAAGNVLQTTEAPRGEDGVLPSSLEMDLEALQGQSVLLYAAANPINADYLRSAYSDAAALAVPKRSETPKLDTASVAAPENEAENTPENAVTRAQFEQGMTLTAQLAEDAKDGNYLGSVYLYDNADAAAAAAERINAGEAPAKQQAEGDGGWLYAFGADENAPMLGGYVLERTPDPKTLTLTMPLPVEQAGRYAVLRLCAAPYEEIASAWAATVCAAPLPQIMQNSPEAAAGANEQTVQAALYTDAELQTPLEDAPTTELTYARKTVQWAPMDGVTAYTVELAPADSEAENQPTTALTVTVQPVDVLDEAGNVAMPAGTITKVEKALTVEDTELLLEIPDAGGYDLSSTAVREPAGENAEETFSLVTVPTTLRGTQTYGEAEAVWAFDAAPVLYFDPEANLYTIALPDAATPLEGSLAEDIFTGTVTITAAGDEGILPSMPCVVELLPEQNAEQAGQAAPSSAGAGTPVPQGGSVLAALAARLTQNARNATPTPAPATPETADKAPEESALKPTATASMPASTQPPAPVQPEPTPAPPAEEVPEQPAEEPSEQPAEEVVEQPAEETIEQAAEPPVG